MAMIEELEEQWTEVPEVLSAAHQVFVSRLIVYQPSTGEIGYLGSEEEGPDGIRIGWKEKFGFPLDDPTVASSDPDQDGFTNFEEYQAETHPKDGEDHPPFVKKLCVAQYQYVPFRMEFKGYSPNASGEGMIYQINLLDVQRRKTRLVQEGEEVEGYLIGQFRKNIVEEFNPTINTTVTMDKSELDILNPVLDETITLVLNVQKESDESRVKLDLNVPGQAPEPSNLRRGETFTIRDGEYQVIEASDQGAVVRKLETGETFKLPKCQTTTPGGNPTR